QEGLGLAVTIAAHTFFFSSRRRHTRSKRDWSSDVCSSDLSRAQGTPRCTRAGMRPPARVHRGVPCARLLPAALVVAALTRAACVPAATLVISIQSPDGHALAGAVVTARPLDAPGKRPAQIGRASCRERV